MVIFVLRIVQGLDAEVFAEITHTILSTMIDRLKKKILRIHGQDYYVFMKLP